MANVLVIDDEKDVCDYLVMLLKDEGFSAEFSTSPREIKAKIQQFGANLLLLDYRMPEQSGSDVVRELRADEQFQFLPIIIVTGLDGEEEKVAMLELGADDYVTKPFSSKELAARIRAVLRRSQQAEEEIKALSSNGINIDLRAHKVFLNQEEVYLTLTEFKILVQLLKSEGKVLSRDELRATALGNLNVADRTIDVHMASLRKKLDPLTKAIQTVRGVGYRYGTISSLSH
ncbi:MAG: response regulator transcription factor [Bdellovibrionales bacterium]|nr:response regulator transcription factor [Bdellovibrionales bacterium]